MLAESAAGRRMKALLTAALLAASLPVAAQIRWTRIVPSPTVELRDPRSMSVAADGLIYVADTGHQRVVAFDSSGTLVVETGGFGDAHGQFRWPRAVVADRGNAVWVLDYGNRRIEKFTRLLVYQGTLEIRIAGSDRANQPEALALSPQGDLFVYDRDRGKLLRYDPLFTLQAESGSGSGLQFISNVAGMAFVPRRGLFWWERGDGAVRHADPLLNAAAPLPLRISEGDVNLSSADTCLIIASMQTVLRVCAQDSPPDTLLTSGDLSGLGEFRTTAACLAGEVLYLLDKSAGAVYRVDYTSK
jgi:DNA-binding beta-propeller fold protein YncE